MPVTAPISLTKVKSEFNGPNNLAVYVRGGAYVPNSETNSAISTTTAGLALSQFLGAAAFVEGTVISTIDTHSTDTRGILEGVLPEASIEFEANGNINEKNSHGQINTYPWLLSGDASEFQIYATKQSSTPPYYSVLGSALGVWLEFGATWTVSAGNLSQTREAETRCTLDIQIRRKSNLEIVSTGTSYLRAVRGIGA